MLVILVICCLLLLLSFSFKKFAHEKEHRGKTYERLTHNHTTTERNATDKTEEETTINPKKEVDSQEQEIIELTSTSEYTDHDNIYNGEKFTGKQEETTTVTEEVGGNQHSKTTQTRTQEETTTATEEVTNSHRTKITPIMMSTIEETASTTDFSITETTFVSPQEMETTERRVTETVPAVSNKITRETTLVADTSVTDVVITSTQEIQTTINGQHEESQTFRAKSNVPTEETTLSFVETTSTEETGATAPHVLVSGTTEDKTTDETTLKTLETRNDKSSTTSTATDIDLRYDKVTTESMFETSSTSTTDYTSEGTTFREFNERDYVEMGLTSTMKTESKERIEDFNSLLFKDKETCRSTRCEFMAARIISSMDSSKLPCENFYNFACGGILGDKDEQVDIFKPEFIENEKLMFLKDFNNFHRSCEKYDDNFNYKKRIATLFHILKNDVYGNDGGNTYKTTKLLANLILLEAFPYLDIGVAINPKNSSSFIMKLKKPKYKSLTSTYWSSFSEERRKCVRKAKKKFNTISNGFQLRNEYWACLLNNSDYLTNIQTLREEKHDMFHEDRPIEEIKQSIENLSKSLLTLNEAFFSPYSEHTELMKVEDLQARYPILNWKFFFSFINNGDIHNKTDIWIDNMAHFQRLMLKLTEIESNLLNVLEAIAEYSIYENIVLQSHVESRTEFCKEQTKYLMPDIAHYIYKIIPDSKLGENSAYVRDLFNRFKKQFSRSLEDNEWIDDQSRNEMKGKLEGIQLSLFDTKDYTEESNFLSTKYNGTMKEDDYPNNLIFLMKNKKKSLLSLQGQVVTAAKIHRYLIDVNQKGPLYFNANGKAYIPYGLIKKASRELPEYLVMAQVGFPLAKIIGQAFTGIDTWDNLSQEVRDKYFQFVVYMKNDGILSKPFKFNKRDLLIGGTIQPYIDDMIAANTAMRLLTDSFEKFGNQSLLPWISYQFSREKIFFLGIAQELCQKSNVIDVLMETYENDVLPPLLRIEDVLSNSEEFSKQFSCTEESRMYRIERMQFPYNDMYTNTGMLS